MKLLNLLSILFLFSTTLTACNSDLPKNSAIRLFKHIPTDDLGYKLESGSIDYSALEPFREGDIFFTTKFGRKTDNTKILYIVPISEKADQSVYITKVKYHTPTYTLEKDVNNEYSLPQYSPPSSANYLYPNRKIYGQAIKIMEDIDETLIPLDTKSISIELFYKTQEKEDKKITFTLTPNFYEAPIR